MKQRARFLVPLLLVAVVITVVIVRRGAPEASGVSASGTISLLSHVGH